MLAVVEGELKFVDVQYNECGMESVKILEVTSMPESWQRVREELISQGYDSEQFRLTRFR